MPSNLLDDALADFPRTEIWRIQTDGWQAHLGKDNFSKNFYKGMNNGFEFIKNNCDADISAALIENIYHAAYKYEKKYKDSALKAGYCTAWVNFPIHLPYPGLEYIAGVSDAGVDNLIETMVESYQKKGDREMPMNQICLKEPDQRMLRLQAEHPEAYKSTFLTYLHQASIDHHCYTGEEESQTPPRLVLIESAKATKDEIVLLVNAEISTYREQLKLAKSAGNDEQIRTAKIVAINRLVQRLHVGHYFGDGNGRTFVFLLANLLLLQNGLGLKITFTPAHYAAFSPDELLAETTHDISCFRDYLITKPREYLVSLTAKNIEDSESIDIILQEKLSAVPLTAMAQINELYLRIKANDMIVPVSYQSTKLPLSLFSQSQDDNKHAHNKVLRILQQLYQQNLQLLANPKNMIPGQYIGISSTKPEPNDINPKPAPEDIFKSIIAQHEISKKIDKSIIKDVITHYYQEINSSLSMTTTTTSSR